MEIKPILQKFIALLYPNRCPFCDKILENKAPCCPSCREKAGKAIRIEPIEHTDGTVHFCSYHGMADRAVTKMKFYDRPDLADGMGRLLAEALLERHPSLRFDYILPVPMTRRDVLRRGYCQTLLLAKAVSKATGIPVMKENLLKTRQTKQQHRLSREERLQNVVEAYGVKRPEQLQGKRVLLCDDVVTTGATMSECAKALKQAGAYSVTVLTFSIAE